MPRLVLLASAFLVSAASARAQPSITVTRRVELTPVLGAATPSAAVTAGTMTGEVRVVPVFRATAPGRATGSDVTFAPGARTAWHTHAAGQTLIVTAGVGRVQQWGGPVEAIRAGDVVHIPPNVKHWHGAAPDVAMTHLAITEAIDGRTVEWLEPVSDAQYRAPVGARGAGAPGAPPAPAPPATAADPRPSVTPRAMDAFAPKLAELTNRVLYGQVWTDSTLSPHDRSLVTLSALIAMNRPDQLRSHLGRARDNGVSREEVAALITHLAFYAGWPNAVTAVTIADEVFQPR